MQFHEETRTYRLGRSHITEINRLVGQCAPDIPAQDVAAAVFAGLGVVSPEDLGGKLSGAGMLRATPDRKAFEGTLAARGHDVGSLQVSLFPDAVRLAVGEPWFAAGRGATIVCVGCHDDFRNISDQNRFCDACGAREGRMPGIHHADFVVRRIKDCVLNTGDTPAWMPNLRQRPGWADLLDDMSFRRELQAMRNARRALAEGRIEELPRGIAAAALEEIHLVGRAEYLKRFRDAEAQVEVARAEVA